MKTILILMILGLIGCADYEKEQMPTTEVAQPVQQKACLFVQGCTNPEGVANYECRTSNYDLTSDLTADRLKKKYPYERCITTTQDYQLNPTCDPLNPTDDCKNPFNGFTYKCCKIIQGPGEPVNL